MCPSLSNLYQRDRSEGVINYLINAQKICGNRAYGRDPILCCTDGVRQPVQRPTIPQYQPPPNPITQPPTTTTTQAPTTQAPIPISNPSGKSCYSPDNIPGNCVGKFQRINTNFHAILMFLNAF